MPVQPGPLTLLFPAWLPGNHRPAGPIDKIAGLEITANGQRLELKRDPLDVYAFHVEVPQGVSSLSMQYQYLTPTARGPGRVVMMPKTRRASSRERVCQSVQHSVVAVSVKNKTQ